MQSFSQSNIQPMGSFIKDMPQLNEVQQIQDTLNLSNDLSNDLIELGNDKQFQNAFSKNDNAATGNESKWEKYLLLIVQALELLYALA